MSLLCNLDYIYSIARACPSFTEYLSKVIDFLCIIDYIPHFSLIYRVSNATTMQLRLNIHCTQRLSLVYRVLKRYNQPLMQYRLYIPFFSLAYRVSNAPPMQFSLYKPCTLIYNSFTGYLSSLCTAHWLSLRVFFSELFFFTFIFNSFRSPRLGSIRL